jgi:hypothetical protein
MELLLVISFLLYFAIQISGMLNVIKMWIDINNMGIKNRFKLLTLKELVLFILAIWGCLFAIICIIAIEIIWFLYLQFDKLDKIKIFKTNNQNIYKKWRR